jgi:predicted methyltransferase
MSSPNHGPVLSGHWLELARRADAPGAVTISLDLGRTRTELTLTKDALLLPDAARLPLEDLRKLRTKPEDCWVLTERGLQKIYIFDPEARRYYKLYQPRPDWAPTVVINNAPMHVIGECPPTEDAERKLQAVLAQCGARGRLGGFRALDTCFGLGYTAAALRRHGAASVLSCEVDRHVLKMADWNPWSADALESPAVRVLPEDARHVLARTEPERFDVVIHDPPTLSLAGEMYADAVLSELFRVLRPGGVLYHYTGSPGGRLGRDVPGKLAGRIRAAGFGAARRVWGGVVGVKAP